MIIQASIPCKGSNICAPFQHPETLEVGYASSGTGELYLIDGGKHHVMTHTNGCPTDVQYDSTHRTLLVADIAHAAILRAGMENTPECSEVLVKLYEEKLFKGPSSITMDDSGSIYFTDSGPLGETTLAEPQGSVYVISSNPVTGQTLRPLAYECLAHPTGICLSPDHSIVYVLNFTGDIVEYYPHAFNEDKKEQEINSSHHGPSYVAEMMMNRILRFVQRPSGVYHYSVFYQFSGGLGPSSLTCDTQGRVYVTSYDFAVPGDTTSVISNNDQQTSQDQMKLKNGCVTVIAADGTLVHTLQVPGSELTGIYYNAEESLLYVTEASTNMMHTIDMSPLDK